MCAHTCVSNHHTCVRNNHTSHIFHAFHASYNFVSFTWESSWLTHVWEAMLLTPPPPHAHVTIKGCSHMCEHMAPFKLVKTLIHVESTWPPPHRSWEILALHLAFDLSRPLHLISYKRRALSSFPHLPSSLLLCCRNCFLIIQAVSTSLLCWICEQPHPMSDEIIYTWWICEVCIGVFWIVYALCLFHVVHLHVFFHILRFAW